MQGEMAVNTRLLRDTLGLPEDVEIVGASFQVGPMDGTNQVCLLLKGNIQHSKVKGYAFTHECQGYTWLRTELHPK